MVAGFLLGMFYSTRYYLTQNLFENIALHAINNLSAILIPIQTTFEDIYPDFILPSMYACLFFFRLNTTSICVTTRLLYFGHARCAGSDAEATMIIFRNIVKCIYFFLFSSFSFGRVPRYCGGVMPVCC